MDLWEPILKEGKDLLHISLSSGLSGEINSARIAQEELKEKYPKRTVKVVDSLGASSGYGLIVDTAYEKRAAGASLEELYQWLEDNKLHMHHWFFSTDRPIINGAAASPQRPPPWGPCSISAR